MRLLFVILVGLSCSFLSHAQNHVVFDWMINPIENHNHWAQRYRFQINDEIVFEYKKGDDSVLVVGEDDYNKCKKDKPIKTLNDGYSIFKFDQSGPFFFISGHDQNCEKGQKMIIVVMFDHHHRHTNPPSPSPGNYLRPPSSAPSPSPIIKPSPSPSPHVKPPSHSPSPSPATIKPPTHAPTHVKRHSPSPSPPPSVSRDSPPPNVNHHAYPPVYLPPHHAPAPAPSSAPSFGGSLILTVGLSVMAIVISTTINV